MAKFEMNLPGEGVVEIENSAKLGMFHLTVTPEKFYGENVNFTLTKEQVEILGLGLVTFVRKER